MVIDRIRDAVSITEIDDSSKNDASDKLDYGCTFVDCSWSIKPEQITKKEI